MSLDFEDFCFLVLAHLFQFFNCFCKSLVHVCCEIFEVVFCDVRLLFKLLQFIDCITTCVAEDDFGVFATGLDILDQCLSSFLCKFGENKANHDTIVVGCDAEVCGEDCLFNVFEL